MTYARALKFDITPGKDNDFKTMVANEVLPMLRKQEGFQEEVTLVKDNHVWAISLWKSRDNINKFHTTVYPELLKKVTPVIKGQPMIDDYEVAGATLNLN